MNIKKFELHFKPKSPHLGVPVEYFKDIITNLQNAIFYIGEYLLFGEGVERSRGPISSKIRRVCTLEITAVERGSLSVELILSDEQLEMFSDIGEQSLYRIFEIIESVDKYEKEKIREIVPDKGIRNKVLRNLQVLDPSKYPVEELEFFSEYKRIKIHKGWTEKIKDIIIEPTTEEVEIVGPIVEIRIIPTRYFGILYEGKRIKCPLDEDLQDVVISLIARVAKITGLAEITPDGKIKEMQAVFNVEPLDTQIFTISYIEWKGRRFYFKDEIECMIDYEDGLWVIESKDLEIIAYGEDFDKAWTSFREDVAFVWDEYVEVDVSSLSESAKKFREKIKNIIEKVEKYD